MNPVTLALLSAHQQRIKSTLGWLAGLDHNLIAWDSGMNEVVNLNGASTDDGGHTWEVHSGTWRRDGGNIEMLTTGNTECATIDTGESDAIIAVDLVQANQSANRDIGIVTRLVDGRTFLIVSLAQNDVAVGSTIRLEKAADSGVGTVARVTLKTVTLADEHRLQPARLMVYALGASIIACINGVPVLQHTLSDGDASVYVGTKHGLGTRNMQTNTLNRWRNFAVWGTRLSS